MGLLVRLATNTVNPAPPNEIRVPIPIVIHIFDIWLLILGNEKRDGICDISLPITFID
jgi:hypothetical protein